MALVSANDLAMMRAAQVNALPDTCTIQRATSGHNTIGEGTLAWSTVGTAIACRVRPANRITDLTEMGGQQTAVANWMATLAHNQDVQDGDRLIMGSDTYEVLNSQRDESWVTAVRCEMRRIG
jgi:hypothetical protein